MTTEYTAEDYARAKFARHEDGRSAVRRVEGTYVWETLTVFLSDAAMAADPGWSIVRDADTMTALEHLEKVWEKAHEADVIPAGAGFVTKRNNGCVVVSPEGAWIDQPSRDGHCEHRLLDPPAPAWHRAQIIRARRDDDHDSGRWARMDSGRWVCLDGESAGIECAPVDLRDVTVIVGAEQ